MNDVYCAMASTDAGEGLFGSAVAETEIWIVLEYTRSWEPKPLLPSELPDAVKERIGGWLEQIPKSRFQFIRRPGRTEAPPLTFYLACSRRRAPWMIEIPLSSYEDLLALDLEAALRDEQAPGGRPVQGPLYLVCTHGKRDRCCARWGVPLYQALAAEDAEAVWQTTHLGGHRFAANVLVLPEGISYGQVAPEEAPVLHAAAREAKVYDLERLRGRTCYGRPAQAAEYFLRRELGDHDLDRLDPVAIEKEGEAVWRVTFEVLGDSRREVRIASEETGTERPASCGGQPEPAARFRRL